MDNNNYKILSVGKGETIVDLRMITICMAAYLLAFWAVGQFGSEMKELIITNLNETAIGGGFFLLLWLILKIYYKADYLYNANIERERTASFTMRGASALPKQTERDDKYTAAHESGHALVYAALGCLPPGIELVIKDNVGIDGSLGYISGINSDHQLNEKTFSEWLMLVFLAGKYGESFAFGENTLGSTNDHQRWLNLAKTYLSNHFDGIFYSDPQNKFEQELNEEKLKKLQCSQKKCFINCFRITLRFLNPSLLNY